MSLEAASIFVRVGADLTALNRGLAEAERGIGGFSQRMHSIGSSLLGAGTRMTAAITAPLVGLGGIMANEAAQFEAATNILSIAARESGTSLEDLRQAAILVGADTQLIGIDAMEAADAMTTFYKSGMTTADVFGDLNQYLEDGTNLTGALRAAIDLAAASDIELAQASDAVAIAMATFGLSAEDATGIANSFVRAADASIAEVSDLTYALENIGPTAAAMGMSLDDVNTTLAVLSTRGIRGAEAGTALKSMLTNMQRPTDAVRAAWETLGTSLYDAEGNMRALPDVMGDIERGLEGMTEEQRNLLIQQLAGTYGMKAMQTLLGEGEEGWHAMAQAMGSAASASDVGETRTQGLAAAMEQLKGSIQTFMIVAGTPLIQNVLTPLVKSLTETIGKLADADPKFLQLGLVIAGIVAAAGPVLLILGGLATVIGAILSPVGLVIAGIVALGAAFIASQGGIGGAVEKLKEIGTSIVNFVTPILNELLAFWDWLWPHLQATFGPIIEDIVAFAKPLIADMSAFFTEQFGRISAWVDENMPLIQQTIETVLAKISEVWETVWPYLQDVVSGAWEVIKGLVSTSIGIVLGVIKAIMQAINGDWDEAWETLKTTLRNAWISMKGTVERWLNIMKDTFGRLLGETWDKIKGWADDVVTGLENQVGDWIQAGEDLIMGLVDGIKAKAQAVIDAAVGVVRDAINGAKRLLGIESPSKVFAEIGQNMNLGLAEGLRRSASVPVVATRESVGALRGVATGRGQTSHGATVTVHVHLDSSAPAAAYEDARRGAGVGVRAALRASGVTI